MAYALFLLLVLILQNVGLLGITGFWNLSVFLSWGTLVVWTSFLITEEKFEIKTWQARTIFLLLGIIMVTLAWQGYIVLAIVWLVSTLMHIMGFKRPGTTE